MPAALEPVLLLINGNDSCFGRLIALDMIGLDGSAMICWEEIGWCMGACTATGCTSAQHGASVGLLQQQNKD